MDRYYGRLGCKCTAYTDADSPALCRDSVWVQRKRNGGCSEECVVDNPRVSSGMAEQQSVDGLYSLSYLSGCTGSGGLPRMYRLRRKAVLAGMGAFAVVLPLVTACYYWFFGADYQRERILFYLSPAIGWDKQPQEVVSNG